MLCLMYIGCILLVVSWRSVVALVRCSLFVCRCSLLGSWLLFVVGY